MYKGLTKKEIKIAKHYENMTEAEADSEHEWAKANNLSFSGPGALSKAIAAAKVRSAARMVSAWIAKTLRALRLKQHVWA